jgi:hypothetical protein
MGHTLHRSGAFWQDQSYDLVIHIKTELYAGWFSEVSNADQKVTFICVSPHQRSQYTL